MKIVGQKNLFKSLIGAVALFAATQAWAAPFTPGNLAVFQADSASANNTTATIVELNPATPGQTFATSNTFPINGTTGTDALRFSGSATSTGYLSHSNDRTLLTFDGHNSTTTSGNANAILPRGVGTLNAAGTFTLQTTYTGATGQQARSASSLDNSAWYIGDQSGLYTNGATTPSPAGNLRGVKAFGGSVYALQQSTTAIVVSTLSAPSGGTITGLPGLTADNTAVDFYMLSSGSNGSTYDELYVATTAGISKYSLVSGSWVSNSVAAIAGGLFGIAAGPGANGTELYVTTGGGAAAANNVLRITDFAGWNLPINLNTPSTLYTAPAGTTVKGIDFAPVAVPEPATVILALIGLAGVGFARRSRRATAV